MEKRKTDIRSNLRKTPNRDKIVAGDGTILLWVEFYIYNCTKSCRLGPHTANLNSGTIMACSIIFPFLGGFRLGSIGSRKITKRYQLRPTCSSTQSMRLKGDNHIYESRSFCIIATSLLALTLLNKAKCDGSETRRMLYSRLAYALSFEQRKR